MVFLAAHGPLDLKTLRGNHGAISALAWSPDNQHIVAGNADKAAVIWDVGSGKEVSRLKGHLDSVSSVAWSADGRVIVTGGSDRTARVWNAMTGTELIHPLDGHHDEVLGVAISRDGISDRTGNCGALA
jgi:WD40 repeat protein